MKNKKQIRKWNNYFNTRLKRGESWQQIRIDLIVKRGYKASDIEKLIFIHSHLARKKEERQKKINIAALATVFLLILVIPFFLFRPAITGMPIGGPGDTFYVDATNGDDSNDGLSIETPIKTIAKANTLPIDPGDSVLFKRGETWRCPVDAYLAFTRGSSDSYVTYGSYGVGDKPKILGSFDALNASMWVDQGSNVWEYDYTFGNEIGNVIFDYESSVGVRNWSLSEISIGGQGYFYFNTTSKRLYLYSAGNPADYYDSIELAEDYTILYLYGPAGSWTGMRWVIVDDLDLRYSADVGIEIGYKSHNITIRNVDVSWIGGAIWSGKTRLGNAIQIWDNASDILIENNTVSEVLDAAFTVQGTHRALPENIIFRNNIADKVAYCYEYFEDDTISANHSFDHNTCYDVGDDWATRTSQRYAQTSKPKCFRLGNVVGVATEISFTNNICHVNKNYLLTTMTDFNGWQGNSNLTIDYNLYNISTTPIILWNLGGSSSYNTLAAYSLGTGKDLHSSIGSPLFTDPDNGDFTPQAGSPACNMSSTGSYVGALPCAGGSSPACGDDVCNGAENCSTCEADCGVCPPVNNAPTHSTPILNASDNPYNTTDASLNCYNQSTADADGDSVTNYYRWFRNNSLVASLTASSINAGNTTSGESWKCEVKPFDGAVNGTARNSSALTINQLPDTVVVRLNSSSGTNYSDENLSCYANVTGFMTSMTIYYRVLNGSAVYASGSRPVAKNVLSSIINVSSAVTSDDETWKCSVLASYDGLINETAWNNASLTVLPVPPEPFCGDFSCNGDENCSTCEVDCGECPIDDTIISCTLINKTWNENENIAGAYDLSSCFTDPLSQSLSYSVTGNNSVIISLGSNGMVNLSAPTYWNGAEHAVFTATAGNRSVSTNNVTFTVTDVALCGDSSCNGVETCSTCESDCGACNAAPSGGGGGGGGGGGSARNESEGWNCDDWSACVNEKQTQDCMHKTTNAEKTNSRSCVVNGSVAGSNSQANLRNTNGENTDRSNTAVEAGVEKDINPENTILAPAEQTPGVISKTAQAWSAKDFISWAITVAVLCLVIYGAISEFKKKPAISPINKSPFSHHATRRLRRYIRKAVEQGCTRQQIKAELIGAGWTDNVVKSLLKMHYPEFASQAQKMSVLESSFIRIGEDNEPGQELPDILLANEAQQETKQIVQKEMLSECPVISPLDSSKSIKSYVRFEEGITTNNTNLTEESTNMNLDKGSKG